MKKQILTDVDGVLLKWKEFFIDYMLEKGYELNPDDAGMNYNLEGLFKNVSSKEAMQHVQLFNDGYWRFGTLQPCEGAVESMYILSSLGYSFVAITSCSDKPEVTTLRKANLYNIFGDVFEEVHCTGVHKSKTPFLELYDPTFWIEDKLNRAIEGAEVGHDAILIDCSSNQNENDDRVKRCFSWAEIVQYILTNE